MKNAPVIIEVLTTNSKILKYAWNNIWNNNSKVGTLAENGTNQNCSLNLEVAQKVKRLQFRNPSLKDLQIK